MQIRHGFNLQHTVCTAAQRIPLFVQSWLLWHDTLSFPLRVKLHNLGATRCSPTVKRDCWQTCQASWSVCGSCFSFSAPTQCVPQEVALIMFYNTKIHSKFMEHVPHIEVRKQLFGRHLICDSVVSGKTWVVNNVISKYSVFIWRQMCSSSNVLIHFFTRWRIFSL